jgi:hypothetical protein
MILSAERDERGHERQWRAGTLTALSDILALAHDEVALLVRDRQRLDGDACWPRRVVLLRHLLSGVSSCTYGAQRGTHLSSLPRRISGIIHRSDGRACCCAIGIRVESARRRRAELRVLPVWRIVCCAGHWQSARRRVLSSSPLHVGAERTVCWWIRSFVVIERGLALGLDAARRVELGVVGMIARLAVSQRRRGPRRPAGCGRIARVGARIGIGGERLCRRRIVLLAVRDEDDLVLLCGGRGAGHQRRLRRERVRMCGRILHTAPSRCLMQRNV